MHENATQDETTLLITSTLSQDANVRRGCLQALQPFDLTDMDWSPHLYLGCHDEDEQNARLAQHIWDDNGLDVPERFLPDLINFLGKDNFCAVQVMSLTDVTNRSRERLRSR